MRCQFSFLSSLLLLLSLFAIASAQPGKAVTAEVSRARDGSNSGLLRILTMPDGKVVSACPQNC